MCRANRMVIPKLAFSLCVKLLFSSPLFNMTSSVRHKQPDPLTERSKSATLLFSICIARISPDCLPFPENNQMRFCGTSTLCLLQLHKDSRLALCLTPPPCLAGSFPNIHIEMICCFPTISTVNYKI